MSDGIRENTVQHLPGLASEFHKEHLQIHNTHNPKEMAQGRSMQIHRKKLSCSTLPPKRKHNIESCWTSLKIIEMNIKIKFSFVA